MKIMDEKYLQRYSEFDAGRNSANIDFENGDKFLSCWGTYEDDMLLVNGVGVKHITVILTKGGLECYILEYDDGTMSDRWLAEELVHELKLFGEIEIA